MPSRRSAEEYAIPFVTLHRLAGNPEDLLRRKRAHFDPLVRSLAPEYGALFSVTLPLGDGLMVLNAWDSPEHAAACSIRPELLADQRASGLPAPTTFECRPDVQLDICRAISSTDG